MTSKLLSSKEAAQHLGISEKTLRWHKDNGDLASVAMGANGGKCLYCMGDLEAFILSKRQVSCPSINEKTKKNTPTTSLSKVFDFQAIREKLRKPAPSKPKSASGNRQKRTLQREKFEDAAL